MCWDVRRKRRVCETNCVRRSLDRKLLRPMKVDQDIDYGKRRHKEEDGGSEESRRPKRSEIVISLESGQSRYESTFAFMHTFPLPFFVLIFLPHSSVLFESHPQLLSKASRHFKSWWVSFFILGDYRY